MLTPHVVPDFTPLKVAVVGDLIADHFLFARPLRLSPEAPVMIMRYTGEEIGAGGAANLARNLWSLGAQTQLLGVLGRDANGREVLRILEQENVDVSCVETAEDWPTPTKTRIMGAGSGRSYQQVLRIDREPDLLLGARMRQTVAEHIRELAGQVDALLISDFAYGLVGEEVGEAAHAVQEAGALVVLDPRVALEPFRGIGAMTPNLSELALATDRSFERLDSFEAVAAAAGEFRERYRPRHLLVTMGNRGMAYFSDDHPEGATVAASAAESVVDVTGAGDTAAVAFTLSLAAGLEGPRAMRIANAAASLAVMESGAVAVSVSRLRSALPKSPEPVVATASVGR